MSRDLRVQQIELGGISVIALFEEFFVTDVPFEKTIANVSISMLSYQPAKHLQMT